MLRDFSASRVRPPQATVLPSGVISTAMIAPSPPFPTGGLRIPSRLPEDSSQTRTVLSDEPVTRNRLASSVAMLRREPAWRPASIARIGSVGMDGPEATWVVSSGWARRENGNAVTNSAALRRDRALTIRRDCMTRLPLLGWA